MLRRRPFRRSRSPFTWRALVFEVVTIVIGVLLALGVNEARERWRETRRTRALSEALLVEYQNNCRSFRSGDEYHRPLLAELDSVIAVSRDSASLRDLPSATRGLSPVLPTMATYETARSTGAVSLLGIKLEIGLGQIAEITTLYRQSVDRLIDVVSRPDARLADMRQPYALMREMQTAARNANCSAYAALADVTGTPADSMLVSAIGSY